LAVRGLEAVPFPWDGPNEERSLQLTFVIRGLALTVFSNVGSKQERSLLRGLALPVSSNDVPNEEGLLTLLWFSMRGLALLIQTQFPDEV
jgi:hypothetical protein